MSVSHAAVSIVTSADEEPSNELPGLLQVLAQVPDPRGRRGKRYLLVFVLAVAVACTLAGARNFREIGDHAADLPQGLLGRLGGRPHPLLRQIIAPSEKRIRARASGRCDHGHDVSAACRLAFPDLGDEVPDSRESEVWAVTEDGVARAGKAHQAGGFRWQLAG